MLLKYWRAAIGLSGVNPEMPPRTRILFFSSWDRLAGNPCAEIISSPGHTGPSRSPSPFPSWRLTPFKNVVIFLVPRRPGMRDGSLGNPSDPADHSPSMTAGRDADLHMLTDNLTEGLLGLFSIVMLSPPCVGRKSIAVSIRTFAGHLRGLP